MAGETLPSMSLAYQPKLVEEKWAKWWEKEGLFRSDVEKHRQLKKDGKRFVMVIPPPNVTGSLHLGHALMATIEDTIVRWRRMKGQEVLWLPGTDHAGIATQVVVEKKLMKERKITRHDLGRDMFMEEVWKWKRESGGRICSQLRHLGASVDWDREVFTMDEARSKAVTEAFVRMHAEGLIYRSTRLVNWCCNLKTAMSDLEVDYITVDKPIKLKVPGHDPNRKYDFGWLTEFAYKVEDSDEEIIVATTRLETMLGDTAVAVHPQDDRYKHLHGKHVLHPFTNRKLPIVTDAELVDMSFGTGAVKITPAHDPNDFKCGRRHNLEFITILDDEGFLNAECGQFEGMARFDARFHVGKKLDELGLLRGKKPNAMRLGLCSRTGDVIEPLVKPQWFVDCKDMAKDAADLVRNGELKIVPEQHKKTWYNWLDDIHDWCISRQLWWGHRIPAYLVKHNGKVAKDKKGQDLWVAARSESEAFEKAELILGVPASELQLEQDPDVLDTWFSSGLFPFSVMGWPDKTDELDTYYPTDLLETGLDILFFWVARMVMMGRKLTGKLPFHTVFLHAMVRDKYGRKMSKSLGNVIDPLEVMYGTTLESLQEKLLQTNFDQKEIEKAKQGMALDYPQGIPECGADALRFGLLAYTVQDRDINLDVGRVAGYRNFCNKLWNATRFALKYLGDDFRVNSLCDGFGTKLGTSFSFADQWILSRLSYATQEANEKMGQYKFAAVTDALYVYWYEICDVYLELLKPLMNSTDKSEATLTQQRIARNVLYTCLEHGLLLLHPLMPFVTEELYQRLPGRGYMPVPAQSIMIQSYPEANAWRNEQVEKDMEMLQKVVHASRSARSANGMVPKQRPDMYIKTRTDAARALVTAHSDEIGILALSDKVVLLGADEEPPIGCSTTVVDESCSVHWMLKGIIDFSKEVKKLEKKKAEVEKRLEGLRKKMNIPDYETKVPQKVRDANAQKMAATEQEMALVDEGIAKYKQLC